MVAGSDIDSLNLKYMYEGAKEIEMLNRSMEAGMRGHNEIEKPLYVESQESIIDSSDMETFQDLGDRYLLKRSLSDMKNSKVKTTILSNSIKIEITTSKKERIVTENGVGESSVSSTTTEEVPIPFDADISRLTKEIKDGLLKVEVPKKRG